MAAITRSRASGSETTGRRASRMIHSTYGCNWSESVMLDALPPLAQPVARALHTHLQRGDTNTSQRRPLRITHFFDVLQEIVLTQQRVQLRGNALHELFIFTVPDLRRVERSLQHRFLTQEHTLSLRA